MRFDPVFAWEALRAKLSSGLPTLAAAGGVSIAALAVMYVLWPDTAEAPVDAVVAAADPVFTPVTLSPPAPVPARRPFEIGAQEASPSGDAAAITRAVQGHLKDAGCYSGPINGRWTVRTREGMADFTRRVNALLPVDRADPVLLALIEAHPTASCTSEPSSTRREKMATVEAAHAIEPEPEAFDDASVEQGSAADRDDPADEWHGTAATAAAGAGAAAIVTAKPRVAKADRPRAKRKVRKKSSFSRNFRKIQRTLSKLF